MTGLSAIEGQFSGELLQAVGLLFITASSAEASLALQMARLLEHPRNMDSRVPFALAGTETKVLLQQIKVLARFRLRPEVAAQVVALCDKIRDAFDRRNDLAHMTLSPGATSDRAVLRPIKVKNDGSLVPVKPITVQQVREFAEKIYGCVRELDDLLTSAGLIRWSDLQKALESLGATEASPGS